MARKLPKQDYSIKLDCTITVLNQYHKLRYIKMKRLCMVKAVKTLQIWEKVVEFHGLAEKDHVRLKWLKDTLKVFVSFRNKQQMCVK